MESYDKTHSQKHTHRAIVGVPLHPSSLCSFFSLPIPERSLLFFGSLTKVPSFVSFTEVTPYMNQVKFLKRQSQHNLLIERAVSLLDWVGVRQYTWHNLSVSVLEQQFIFTLLTYIASITTNMRNVNCLRCEAIAIASYSRLIGSLSLSLFYYCLQFLQECQDKSTRSLRKECRQVSFTSSHLMKVIRFWIWLNNRTK